MNENVESSLQLPPWFTRKEGHTLCTKRPADNIPYDVWNQIIQYSVHRGAYDFRDVCSISLECKVLGVGREDRVWSKFYFDHFRSTYNGTLPVKTAFRRRFKRTRRAVERIRYHRDVSSELDQIVSYLRNGDESLWERVISMRRMKVNQVCEKRRRAAERGEDALQRAICLLQSERSYYSTRRWIETLCRDNAREDFRHLKTSYDG